MMDMCLMGLISPFIAGGMIYLVWCLANLSFVAINNKYLSVAFYYSGVFGLAVPAYKYWAVTNFERKH